MDADVNPESESATALQDQRTTPMVNGCFVYTRAKRSRNSCNGFSDDGECERIRSNAEDQLKLENGEDCCTGSDEVKSEHREVDVRTFKRITRSAMKASVASCEEEMVTELEQVRKSDVLKNEPREAAASTFKRITRSAMKARVESGVETVNELEQVSELKREPQEVSVRMFKRITRSAMKANVESGEEKVTNLEQIRRRDELKSQPKEVVVRTFKRITRSAMKESVESGEEIVTDLEQVAAIDGRINGPRNKLELKMSKKIVVNRKPMTVKELFNTGLLDGVSVVYMGSIKEPSGLRGVIRDGGILCSCCLCNGLRVIPPSQFEIHACKQYRRAAEYICLENGKSLRDLLRACKGAPLHTLEATVQNLVCSPREEKYFTCKRCKECFPSSCVGKAGPICCSCVESRKSEESSNNVVSKRIRSPRPVLVSNSSTTSEVSISSKSKRHWNKRAKSPKRVGGSNSSKSASVPVLPRKKNMLKMKKKSLSVKSKTPTITSNSKCLTTQNKSKWKITKKDQRLHKLVFEENGLPDGTEVAYYARGQKLLEGFKRGSGIVCRCCNTEISPSQFEVHAGWASRKKPYAYIYTSNGVSLHELAISLSKDRKYSAKDNDDLCIVCWDGGNLLLCDGCPRAFHKDGEPCHKSWSCCRVTRTAHVCFVESASSYVR